jgi:hypothetical protein
VPLPPPKWKPLGIFDALAQSNIPSSCEECGRKLRWAHRIVEARGPRILHVGGCCADRLCLGTEYDPKAAERQARNRAGRLRNLLGGGWRRYRGAVVTAYQKSGWWGFCLKVRGQEPSFSNRMFRTAEDAKVAAFDRLEELTR